MKSAYASVAGNRTTAEPLVLVVMGGLSALELPLRLAFTPASLSVKLSSCFLCADGKALVCVLLNAWRCSLFKASNCVALSLVTWLVDKEANWLALNTDLCVAQTVDHTGGQGDDLACA